MESIKADVKRSIGNTISTVWGECTVVGLGKNEEGNDIIVLSEDEEEFTVKLEDWGNLL